MLGNFKADGKVISSIECNVAVSHPEIMGPELQGRNLKMLVIDPGPIYALYMFNTMLA